MSQINTFGIGAGRTIAGDSDEDDERLRQRRLSKIQRSEQARRSAALHERIAQSEQAHAMLAVQPQARQQHSSTYMQDLQDAALPKPPSDASSDQSMSERIPARPAGIGETNKIDNEKATIPALSHDGTPEGRLRPSDTLTRLSSAPTDGRQTDAERPVDLPDPVSVPADSVTVDLANSAGQLMQLADELAAFRGPQFTEKLAARLGAILSAMRSHPQPMSQSADTDELYAGLEFIEGYVEAASIHDDGVQKLLQLTGELRQQLLGLGLPSPALQPLVAVTAIAAQISSDKGRGSGVTEVRGHIRLKPQAGDRRADADHEEEIEAEINAALLQSSQLSPGGPVRTSQSSLSKDAEKRKTETLVTVTVRSV